MLCLSNLKKNKYSILRRTAIILSCGPWLCVLHYVSKLQDPSSNLLRVVKEAHAYISARVSILFVKAEYRNTQLLPGVRQPQAGAHLVYKVRKQAKNTYVRKHPCKS